MGLKLVTAADDLREGLFGQLLLYAFEVLPTLAARGERPAWDIRSRLYGPAPHHRVLPGAFDLAYQPPERIDRVVSLLRYQDRHQQYLGNDWPALHALWHRYFTVPPRTVAAADAVFGGGRPVLGLHYRGTDKNRATRDTNPVSEADFLTLAREFVARHPGVGTLFVATDQHSFAAAARAAFRGHEVINLGAVDFHKRHARDTDKADRAVLDMLLLSRCTAVLKCSSALSAFAKVLNPALPVQRVAASKLYAHNPYFPNAYIDRFASDEPHGRAILQRQFAGDWLESATARRRFGGSFAARRPGAWRQCGRFAEAWARRGKEGLRAAWQPLRGAATVLSEEA